MKFDRTKNASRNMVFGIALKLYQILVPFAMRTAMIHLMGVQYLGLDGLFVSVLSVLNLAELGVGTAMVYSMYKPIAVDDKKTICALMWLYKIYYRIIGLVVLIGGLILLPFIPKLISGGVPDSLNVYILYLLNLSATVLSYWLFAYKNCLLQAHQRSDVVSKVTLVVHTIRYGFQFILLFVFRNYYYYLIVALLSQLMMNILTSVIVDKMYPQYRAAGELEKEQRQDINHRIRDLFTAKIGAVIVDSVDTIVISAFLGLTILGIYQNYFYILTAITGIINIVMTSCLAGIGNSIVVEKKEKVFAGMKVLTFIVAVIDGCCTACMFVLYQPFMELWAGKSNMFEMSAVICFCIYFYVKQINTLLNVYKDAAGIWHEDRFRPLVTALSNLAMNLIMVQFWGIYGVLLSTVISMVFVGMPWLLHNLFTVLYPQNLLSDYLKQLLGQALTAVVACFITYGLASFVTVGGILGVLIRLLISGSAAIIIYIIIYHNKPEFRQAIVIINRITRGRIPVIRNYA